MNEPNAGERRRLQSALRDAFQAGWGDLLAADDVEPDLQRLAAFAEGRLSREEEEDVLRDAAHSPTTMEILTSLLDETSTTPHVTGSKDAADRPALKLSEHRAAMTTRARRTAVAMWAAAACLMLAIGAVLYGWDRDIKLAALGVEATELRKQQRETARSLLVAQKEQLATLAADIQQPYLSGESSTEMLRLALKTMGQPRGAKALSSDEADSLTRAAERVTAAAEQLSPQSAASRLEAAAALIQAGRLDQAQETLDQLGAFDAMTPDMRRQAKNLRGMLLAARAQPLPPAEARPLLTEAEKMLRDAADAGLSVASLNLALLQVEQQNVEEARQAASRYLEAENDPERRAIVESAFRN
jgi:hypothetical protein